MEDFNSPSPKEEYRSSGDDYDINNDGNGNDNGDDGDNHNYDDREKEERQQLGHPPTGLSDYELLHLCNIESNDARLASLGLGGNGKSYQICLEAAGIVTLDVTEMQQLVIR